MAMACLVTVGCASTDLTSQRAPDFKGKAYTKLLVWAGFEDLALKKRAETKISSAIVAKGGASLVATEILFPGKEYSAEEVHAMCRANQVDGILVVTPTDAGHTEHYVPPTYHTYSSATGTATTYGNTTYGQATGQSTTYTTGGYTMHKPWANFSARLIDVQSGQVAWIATANSRGNALADSADLVDSFAARAVRTLVQDGALVVAPPTSATPRHP